MHDRNEKALKTISPNVVPIEIFDVLRAARWRWVKLNRPTRGLHIGKNTYREISTHFGVAWDPVEMSYFLWRMLGEDEK